MKRLIVWVSSIAAALTVTAPVLATIPTSDDFAFEDLTKWTKVQTWDGTIGGQIANLNGQAVYSSVDDSTTSGSDDIAGYIWNFPSSTPVATSWEAMIDVFMPSSSLGNNQYTDLSISVVWPNPLPSLEPVNYTGITLSQDGQNRGFYADKKTGATELDLASLPTATTTGSLRIKWDAPAGLFSFSYDPDGGQDSWNLLTTTDINGWGMQNSDNFVLAVIGGSGDISVQQSEGIALDNFNVQSVPEPSAILLFAFGTLTFLRKRFSKYSK